MGMTAATIAMSRNAKGWSVGATVGTAAAEMCIGCKEVETPQCLRDGASHSHLTHRRYWRSGAACAVAARHCSRFPQPCLKLWRTTQRNLPPWNAAVGACVSIP